MAFVKGDPRINRKGRPKNFDQVRSLALDIAHEPAIGADGKPIIINGHGVTVAEAILRKWSTSKDARLQTLFMEYAFGKVPQRQEVTGEGGGDIVLKVVYDKKAEPNA